LVPYLLPAQRSKKDKVSGKVIPGFTKLEVQESIADYFEVNINSIYSKLSI
jgi:hypothetical protein